MRPDRLYRVYCQSGAIRFIRIGGQRWGLAYGLESQGGSIGGALAKRARAREEEKLRRAEFEADAFDPEFLLSRHRHNLRVLSREVTEARILPLALLFTVPTLRGGTSPWAATRGFACSSRRFSTLGLRLSSYRLFSGSRYRLPPRLHSMLRRRRLAGRSVA